MPNGDFFKALSHSVGDDAHIVPFLWSGKNSHLVRFCTAQALVALIKSYIPKNTVHIIGHSHGANIGFLASGMLAEQYKTPIIESFFGLGVPINTKKYPPSIAMIRVGWNLFSTKDTVQPIFGRFQRILDPSWNFYNMRVFLENNEPEHFQLHSPLIAQWIGNINKLENREKNYFLSRLMLSEKGDGLIIPEIEDFFDTKTTFFSTVSTAFKLAGYKAKSINRSRQRRKKIVFN